LLKTNEGSPKKRGQERKRGGKLMKIKGKWRVASDEWRDKAQKPPTPEVLYGCETKRVAGKGICNGMKTKGEEKWLVVVSSG
jgi:hypothetical protein